MNKKDILISLCSFLCLKEGIKPLSNSEFLKFSKNLDSFDFIDLPNKKKDELLKLLFGFKENYTDKEILFIDRIDKLIARLPSMQFFLHYLNKWGIYIMTIFDSEYPSKIKEVLKEKSPVLLYYSGDISILNRKFIGFVGNRKIDEDDTRYIDEWVKLVVKENYGVVSGGVNGVDTQSVFTAIDNSGYAIEFLSDSMIKRIKNPKINKAIREKKMLLLSETIPTASFKVGSAMTRNKYIYMLSEKTIVIKAEYVIKNNVKTGGTWNGAIENLKSDYKRVYCRDNNLKAHDELISYGAIPINDTTDAALILNKEENKNLIFFPIGKEVNNFISYIKESYHEKYETLFSIYEENDLEKKVFEIIIDYKEKEIDVSLFISYLRSSIEANKNSNLLYDIINELLNKFALLPNKKKSKKVINKLLQSTIFMI